MEEAQATLSALNETAPTGGKPTSGCAAQPKHSYRLLPFMLALALVLLTASGAALAVYFAPIHTVERFCQAVAAQDDAHAYQLLTSGFRQQHPRDQFARDIQMLDDAEGRITSCGDSSILSLANPDVLMGNLTVMTVLRRGPQGEMRGQAHLHFEEGAWRIDGLGTSLLGVDLGALETTLTFCDALQRQNYGTVYTLLNAYRHSTTTELEFIAQGRAWDQIGGQVSRCNVASIERSGSDGLAQLAIGVTRTRAGLLGGIITLTRNEGQWTIQALDQVVFGVDLGPLVVGRQFCANLSIGAFHDAYMLLSRGLRAILPEHGNRWSSYTVPGLRWTCIPDFATYIVKGNIASYVVAAQVTDSVTGNAATLPRLLFTFVRDDGVWKLDNISAPTS